MLIASPLGFASWGPAKPHRVGRVQMRLPVLAINCAMTVSASRAVFVGQMRIVYRAASARTNSVSRHAAATMIALTLKFVRRAAV